MLTATALFALSALQEAPPPEGPQAIVEDLRGGETRIPLAGLELQDLRDRGALFVRFAELGRERPDTTPLDPTKLASLKLVGGDLLHGRVLTGDGDELTVLSSVGTAVSLSVDALQELVFTARVDDARRGALEAPSSGDRLYWVRGEGLDRIDGTLEAFEATGLSFDSVLGTKSFPWDELAALFIEALGDPPELEPSAGALPVVCDLHDGGRMSGQLLEITPEHILLRWNAGGEWKLDLAALEGLTIDDGALTFLSELDPIEVDEGSPFDDELGLNWPHRRDRSVTGRALQVGGRTWRRGLGVHAPSRLTWELGGAWSELRGAVGVDDEVLDLPHRGSVNFRVYVDGVLKWESGVLRGGEGARDFPPISLSGAAKLTLEADMATQSFIADRADWLRPLLVR